MARSGVIQGARAPLFDRLAGREPPAGGDPPRALRILDRSGVRESIRRELTRLLNTRRPEYGAQAIAGLEPTVIEYGLADYSAMHTQDPEAQKRLSAMIRDAIERFEPRLREPKVEARPLAGSEKALLVAVSGTVTIGREVERMTFSVSVAGRREKETPLGS
jgi:type VI secretion system lysozyme-like protein